MSRRLRERENSRPWDFPADPQTDRPDQDEEDTEPFYLSTGDRIDARSAWQMPGQQEQPR